MSRADAAERITRAAIALGAAEGVGALTLQAIARAAGVSKALLLYHFDGKAALLDAVTAALGAASEARLRRAADRPDALDAWRGLVRDEAARGELALLSALSLEAALDIAPLQRIREGRETAATGLATAMLSSVQLAARVPTPLLGRLVLRHLDGVAATGSRDGTTPAALDDELDAFALALLALGN